MLASLDRHYLYQISKFNGHEASKLSRGGYFIGSTHTLHHGPIRGPSHLTSGTISKSLDMTTGPPYLHTVEWLCSRWLLLLKLNPYYINWSSIYQIKDKLRGSSDTHICFEDLQLYNEPTQTALFMKPHCKNWLPLTSSHTSHLTPHTSHLTLTHVTRDAVSFSVTSDGEATEFHDWDRFVWKHLVS